MTDKGPMDTAGPAAPVTETETDHEFRLRMAREGRAIYLPGITVEEVRAKAARKTKPKPLTLGLSDDELDVLDKALPDLMALVSDAGRAFDLLAAGFALGHFDSDDAGVRALMRLSSRALTLAEDRELAAVDALDMKLRQSRNALDQGSQA